MAARRREAKRKNWPANLYQNGAGYFYWRDPQTKKDYGLGRDQAKAFHEARQGNAQIETVRNSNRSLVDRIMAPDSKTLAQWAIEYLDVFEKTRKPAAATLKTMKSGVRIALTAPFATRMLPDIQTKDVAEFIATATEERGPHMAALIRRAMKDLFREAEMRGLIKNGANPVSVTRIPTSEVKRARLTLEQFLKIYAYLQEHGHPWEPLAMELALLSAQRREDVANMQFQHVREGFLFVDQSKTGHKMRIPTSLRLEVVGLSLETTIKKCRDLVGAKYLLHHMRKVSTVKPGDPIGTNLLTRFFAVARDGAGVTWDEGKTAPSFHEIRSLAARLYSDQYGPEFAQALLGHKSAEMTQMYRDTRGSEWTEIKLLKS